MNKDNYIHTPYNDEWIAQRADPFVYRHTDGTCYFTASVPAYDRIILRAANDLGGLVHAEEKTLWVRHESGPQSIHIWAPEIHYLFGGWYIYYAAGDKDDIWNIRPYVLHCKGQNPMKDEWEELGMMQAADSDEFSFHAFSLDATVFEHRGEWYMTWSGWQSRRVSTEHQCIYIAKMKNPWTLESDRVLLSKPEFEWERQWINPDGSKTAYTIYVNESPQFYKSRKGDKIFIFYSASGTWTCFYAVGMLMADADSDLLDPDSWTKSTRPVFKQCPENKVYGPGHVSFIPSPDGKEDYLLYDARSVENDPAGL